MRTFCSFNQLVLSILCVNLRALQKNNKQILIPTLTLDLTDSPIPFSFSSPHLKIHRYKSFDRPIFIHDCTKKKQRFSNSISFKKEDVHLSFAPLFNRWSFPAYFSAILPKHQTCRIFQIQQIKNIARIANAVQVTICLIVSTSVY